MQSQSGAVSPSCPLRLRRRRRPPQTEFPPDREPSLARNAVATPKPHEGSVLSELLSAEGQRILCCLAEGMSTRETANMHIFGFF